MALMHQSIMEKMATRQEQVQLIKTQARIKAINETECRVMLYADAKLQKISTSWSIVQTASLTRNENWLPTIQHYPEGNIFGRYQ